jgi:O-antigen/teichoic acid export membrane protein
MFRFGGFSFLANEFALVVSTADILCISYLLKDASLVGFYYIAVALMRGFRLIPSTIMQTALPYISEKSIDAQSTQNLYFKLLKKMTLLMLFVCIVLYFVGGKFLVLLFGNTYIPSVPVFNVLLIGLF